MSYMIFDPCTIHRSLTRFCSWMGKRGWLCVIFTVASQIKHGDWSFYIRPIFTSSWLYLCNGLFLMLHKITYRISPHSSYILMFLILGGWDHHQLSSSWNSFKSFLFTLEKNKLDTRKVTYNNNVLCHKADFETFSFASAHRHREMHTVVQVCDR